MRNCSTPVDDVIDPTIDAALELVPHVDDVLAGELFGPARMSPENRSRQRPVVVLELPYGIRDGLSSLGDFNAVSQFHQTRHGKRIAGGYLSRVSGPRKALHVRLPVRGALIRLSERQPLEEGAARRALAAARGFLRASRVGYVVIDRGRASDELRRFAIDAFGLVKIAEDGSYELYVPQNGPL